MIANSESVDSLANPWCFLSLRNTVQALALPADIQLSLYPDGADKIDELALDFDNFWRCVQADDGDRLSTDQAEALALLDRELSEMSGAQKSELWTEAGLAESPEWEHVRLLAKQVLVAFGWPNEIPQGFDEPYEALLRAQAITIDEYRQRRPQQDR